MKDFLLGLAELLDKHDIAICATPIGGSEQVVFQSNEPDSNNRVRSFSTGRQHNTAYEIRRMAAEDKQNDE